jgi:superfamily II DNA or RNA helicase
VSAIPSSAAVALLDFLEREERKLLCWGYTEGSFTAEELETHAKFVLAADPALAVGSTFVNVLEELLAGRWLFRIPVEGTYRTRSAETVRLISKLRQIRVYPNTRAGTIPSLWRTAPPLVADFRFQAPPRVFPRRDQAIGDVDAVLEVRAESLQHEILKAFVGSRRLSGFQVRAASRMLNRPSDAGTVVCSGTGSGKTIAFYLPAYMILAPLLDATSWTKCIAVYPRNELLKDQLREAVANGDAIRPVLKMHGRRGLTFGALYGEVKEDAGQVGAPRYGWQAMTVGGRPGRVCPFMRCPVCGEAMLWVDEDRSHGYERLCCTKGSCGKELGPDIIRLTRGSLRREPPDVFFVSTEMVNRNMSSSAYLELFGIRVPDTRRPRLLLLDEIHTYDGSSGAHVALLLRRWRYLSKAKPHVVGLSATLEDAPRFFSELSGLPLGDVEEVSPHLSELEAEGADYQLAIRGDSGWGTSLLSTTIQTLMLLPRVLEPRNSVQLTLAGSRVFAFSDRLDGINRLLEDLRDAEGRWGDSNSLNPRRTVLAGLRDDHLPDADARYVHGQSWDLVQAIRPHLSLRPTQDNSLVVTRTTAQDTGVDPNSDVVVATASLEVGYDDPTVGAVVQHKAPRSSAAFLQRKGRAGRLRRVRPDGSTVSMRPWTVVVLSDFGKDRIAYQDYEHIFSPTLRPRHLPTRNRALLRMQATYALFDFMGLQATRAGLHAEPWTALARPAHPSQFPELEEQRFFAGQLELLLEDGNQQREFARFLQGALAISADEVNALLWEPPRSVMLEAVPTLYRRLAQSWRRSFENSLEPVEKYGPPLPDFVQRTLFGRLLVPEVKVRLPMPRRGADDELEEQGMVLAEALREFAPGRVSKRFDVRGGVSHWIAPDGGPTMSIDRVAKPEDRLPAGRFTYFETDGPREVDVYRPTAIDTSNPDQSISATSSGRARWRSQLVFQHEGFAVEPPQGTVFSPLVESISFHTHHLGNPVEVRRFVIGAVVALTSSTGRREPERSIDFVNAEGQPAALGWESEVDALSLRIRFPENICSFVASSPELLRTLRTRRFHELVGQDPVLDGILNSFQRTTVVEAFLAALLDEIDVVPAATVQSVCESVGADTIARMIPAIIDAEQDHDDGDGNGAVPRRVKELIEALQLSVVMEQLLEHAAALWHPIHAGWETWLRQVLKSTLGASLREAIITVCPDIDDDELVVEGAAVRDDDGATVWITESAIGGSGALEAFYGAYAKDPRQFSRIWHGTLLASDFEKVAASFERTLELLAGPAPAAKLVSAVGGVRSANGNVGSQRAIQQLREALANAGISAEHATLTAIFARILRPGGTPALDSYLLSTLTAWRALEGRSGLAVELRLFALIHSARPGIEAIVPTAPISDPDALRTWRRETLHGLLWRRPTSIRREALTLGNPYADTATCDRLIVPLPDVSVPVVRAESATWFDELTDALNHSGVVRIRAAAGDEATLASALRWIAIHPIDTGGLLIFARLAGFSRRSEGVEITLEMPEALQ